MSLCLNYYLDHIRYQCYILLWDKRYHRNSVPLLDGKPYLQVSNYQELDVSENDNLQTKHKLSGIKQDSVFRIFCQEKN